MPRVVRCGLIQASNVKSPAEATLAEVREAMVAKHLRLIEDAVPPPVEIACNRGLSLLITQFRKVVWSADDQPLPGTCFRISAA